MFASTTFKTLLRSSNLSNQIHSPACMFFFYSQSAKMAILLKNPINAESDFKLRVEMQVANLRISAKCLIVSKTFFEIHDKIVSAFVENVCQECTAQDIRSSFLLDLHSCATKYCIVLSNVVYYCILFI